MTVHLQYTYVEMHIWRAWTKLLLEGQMEAYGWEWSFDLKVYITL